MNLDLHCKKNYLTVGELREFLYTHPEIPDNLKIYSDGCDCIQEARAIQVDNESFKVLR